VSYAEALHKARSIAQGLLDRGLSADRPVAILSENGIEHALVALGCLHAGVPYCPVSPPYSIVSQDFDKLRHVFDTLTPGLVFAADGLRNVIYRLDGGALKPMVENPKLTSLRGLAVSGDGKKLYFADYVLGVFGVDLAAGKGFDLVYDPNKLALGGIDGLYWYDNALIVIENGMRPQRVMRLKLGNDGREVINTMPLDSANPAFKLPTFGAIKGDALYFVANSQKNAYDSYGSPKADAKLEPVKVFRSDLRFAWDDGASGNADKPAVISHSTPGAGTFSNVDGGSQSVTGN
jgi:hypothetical protein